MYHDFSRRQVTVLYNTYSGATGIEPAISGLTGRRDNQTSLHPLCNSIS